MKKIILISLLFVLNCFGKSILYTYVNNPSIYKIGEYAKFNDNKYLYRDRMELEKHINTYKKYVTKGICNSNKTDFEKYIENEEGNKCSIFEIVKEKISNDKNELNIERNKEILNDIERIKSWKIEDKNKITAYRILQIKEIDGYDFLVMEKAY